MTKIKEVIRHLETIAPPVYQESYDNSGLIYGDPEAEVKAVIFSLDAVESVLDEAIAKGANLVISHHPIIFRGIKKFQKDDYVARVVIKAIQHNIALYAIHTNLDNVLHQGVNELIAKRLGLEHIELLSPKKINCGIELQCSALLIDEIQAEIEGMVENLPFPIELQRDGNTIKLSCPQHLRAPIVKIAQHYQAKYFISEEQQANASVGTGIVGSFALPMTEQNFLAHVKEKMETACIRHSQLLQRSIQRVAIVGGSGSFMLSAAMAKQADAFITGDFKYHEFFDADHKILISDIGHYESEQFTVGLLKDIVTNKFSTFAAHCVQKSTNPIFYYQ